MPTGDDYMIEFEVLDEHVKKASLEVGCSFSSLKDYILQQCPSETYRTLFLFRGVFIWILDNYQHEVRNPDKNSPLYLISEYQAGNLSINVLIDVLCSEFNISTMTIHGLSRLINEHTDSSDIRAKTQSSWNAIDIDGSWFFLRTDMFFSAKAEQDDDNCKRKEVSSTRYRVSQFRPCIDDTNQEPETSFDEVTYKFLISPETFINFCYPDDPEKQLLPNHNGISYQDFLNRPLLHPAFFRHRFDFLTENTCRVKAEKGKCYISLYTDKTIASDLEITCELIRIVDRDSYLLPKEVTLIMVTQFRTLDTFTFEFKFAEEGRYRAVIYCQVVETTASERCCEFEISCKEANTCPDDLRNMSVNASNTVGIGPAAISAGIISCSEVYPKSFIGDGEIKESLKFRLAEEMLYSYEYWPYLEALDKRERLTLYVDCVSYEVDNSTAELTVTVNIPKKRARSAHEFILRINARNRGGDGNSFVPVYYHLFSKKKSDSDGLEIKELEVKRKKKIRERRLKTLFEEEQYLKHEIQSLEKEIKLLVKNFPKIAEEIKLDKIISDAEDLNGSKNPTSVACSMM